MTVRLFMTAKGLRQRKIIQKISQQAAVTFGARRLARVRQIDINGSADGIRNVDHFRQFLSFLTITLTGQ